jgi:hypothetical protein
VIDSALRVPGQFTPGAFMHFLGTKVQVRQLVFGPSAFIAGKIFKVPFGGREATLEISPAQRAGY